MSCSFFNRFLVIIVGFVNRFYALILGSRLEQSLVHRHIADPGAVNCVVRNPLCQDIHGSLNGILSRLYALFPGNITGRRLFHRLFYRLKEDQVCQRLQSLFMGNGGPCAAFWLIGTVKILYSNQRGGAENLTLQLGRHLSLVSNRCNDLFFAVLQAAEIF